MDTVPVIVTDENVTKLRVDNVMDLVEERPMNLIHGQHVFRVAGFNMVLSDEGAAAYLENAHGTTFPLVVDEVVSKQLFKAHTAELLPGGDYKLTVKSRAGDAAGPLQTSYRKVKYLRVVDPGPEVRLDSIATGEDEGVIMAAATAVITGENLGAAEGDEIVGTYEGGSMVLNLLAGSDDTRMLLPVEDVPAVGTVVTFAWKGKTISATVAE